MVRVVVGEGGRGGGERRGVVGVVVRGEGW